MVVCFMLALLCMLLLQVAHAVSLRAAMFGECSSSSSSSDAADSAPPNGLFRSMFGRRQRTAGGSPGSSGSSSSSSSSSGGGSSSSGSSGEDSESDPVQAQVNRIRAEHAEGKKGKHHNGRARADLDMKIQYLYNDDHIAETAEWICCVDECCGIFSQSEIKAIRQETYDWLPNCERSEKV
jgi:hypothetical protein